MIRYNVSIYFETFEYHRAAEQRSIAISLGRDKEAGSTRTPLEPEEDEASEKGCVDESDR